MLSVKLLIESDAHAEALSSIVSTFDLTVVSVAPIHDPYLALCAGRLSLFFPSHPKWQPLSVDFQSPAWQHRLSVLSIKKERLARAVGLRGNAPLSVIDATAGLGQDSYLMAALGAEVICVERHPVLAALLTDGLNRAREMDVPATKRMTLIHQSAHHYLTQPGVCADVLYLDPMYPNRDAQSAKQKKALQMLRLVVGEDPDADGLLATAKAAAKQRVVVKRPKNADYLADQCPDYQLLGASSRFDVYLLAR